METIETARLRLVLLGADAIDELLRDQPPWLDADFASFLRMRCRQLRDDAAYAPWGPRLVTLRDDGEIIGHAGFHGPPGTNSPKLATAVEIGYTIFEQYRRRGYATETARALLEYARRDASVDRVIASVSPENDASLAIVRRLGFTEIGRHWDDEDGDELEFQLLLNDET